MNIYLVQHAKALSKEEDPDRPLSDVGRRETEVMARHAAAQLNLQLGRIWNSGKTRAAQTAEILAEHLKPTLGVRTSEEMGPVDDPTIWADRLKEVQQDVMLVGHLPHLDRLSALLLTGDPDRSVIDFRNSGLVCLTNGKYGWSIHWILTPDLVAERSD